MRTMIILSPTVLLMFGCFGVDILEVGRGDIFKDGVLNVLGNLAPQITFGVEQN